MPLAIRKSSTNWIGLYIALGVVWGCSFIFIKLGLEFLTPVGVAFGRVSLGALTLVFWARFKGIQLPTDKKIWFHLWVVSLLLNVIPGVLFAVAETEVTSILAGIINAVTPLMTLLAIMIAFHEEKPVRNWFTSWFSWGTYSPRSLARSRGKSRRRTALLLAVTCESLSTRKLSYPENSNPKALAAVSLRRCDYVITVLFNRWDYQGRISLGPVFNDCISVFGSGLLYRNFKIMEARNCNRQHNPYVTRLCSCRDFLWAKSFMVRTSRCGNCVTSGHQ